MNLEKIRIKYLEIGLPLMLCGSLIYALGYIIDYVTQTIPETSYIQIRFLVLLGMCFIVVGAGSLVFLKDRGN